MDYLGDDNTAVISNTVKQGLSLTCADPAIRNLGLGSGESGGDDSSSSMMLCHHVMIGYSVPQCSTH